MSTNQKITITKSFIDYLYNNVPEEKKEDLLIALNSISPSNSKSHVNSFIKYIKHNDNDEKNIIYFNEIVDNEDWGSDCFNRMAGGVKKRVDMYSAIGINVSPQTLMILNDNMFSPKSYYEICKKELKVDIIEIYLNDYISTVQDYVKRSKILLIDKLELYNTLKKYYFIDKVGSHYVNQEKYLELLTTITSQKIESDGCDLYLVIFLAKNLVSKKDIALNQLVFTELSKKIKHENGSLKQYFNMFNSLVSNWENKKILQLDDFPIIKNYICKKYQEDTCYVTKLLFDKYRVPEILKNIKVLSGLVNEFSDESGVSLVIKGLDNNIIQCNIETKDEEISSSIKDFVISVVVDKNRSLDDIEEEYQKLLLNRKVAVELNDSSVVLKSSSKKIKL